MHVKKLGYSLLAETNVSIENYVLLIKYKRILGGKYVEFINYHVVNLFEGIKVYNYHTKPMI